MPDETEGFEPETTRPSLRQRETGSTQGVTRWRKKPIPVEAKCWQPGDLRAAGEVVGWLMANGADFHHPSGQGETTTLAIRTLEGEMLAQPGDWIIRGVKGEFYPCRADIFAETYQPADGDQVTVSREDLRAVLAIADDYGVLTWEQERARDRLSAAAEVK